MNCRPARHFLLFGLLLAGCASWQTLAVPRLPQSNSLSLDELVIYSDTPLPEKHRLIVELNEERSRIESSLSLPVSDERVYVYLFSNAETLKHYINSRHPDFPDRRAFFVETDTRLTVYAYWGDRVAEDLRHEVAHGYLHSVVPRIPLWLDEGLAEYFEVARGHHGLNEPHLHELATILASGWHPDLRRLEMIESASDMRQIDYAEAWAWVYYLLEIAPQRGQILRDYLRDLRLEDEPATLSARLADKANTCQQELADYVAGLASSLR